MTRRSVIFILSLVLLLAAGFAAYGFLRPLPTAKFQGTVRSLLPSSQEVPGWAMQEENIAETPEMKRAVAELLNFDDAAFVTYTKGGERLSVYIAYWKPGKMSTRLVRGHTPDVCWVGGGWQTMEARHAVPMTSDANVRVETEQRRMRHGSREEWVVFWHLVDGTPTPKLSEQAPWHAIFTDTFREGINQRGEQLFVRISAPMPVEQWPKEWIAAFLERYRRAMGPPI